MAIHSARGSIWAPVVAPVIWAVYFTVTYAWVALACGRLAGNVTGGRARAGIAILTVVACAAIGLCLRHGFYRHGRTLPNEPNDDATAADRTRFMAFTTMLLAALSLIATAFVGAAAVSIGGCE
ncbi:MAG TPA: hypothetical protein VEA16_17175 [Vicinamibacterales bacterium]|nr:hypothetical protein [Vicinamibacterales bacterium]